MTGGERDPAPGADGAAGLSPAAETGGGRIGERRLTAAQFYADASQYVLDNPHLFLARPEAAEGGGEAGGGDAGRLAVAWSRLVASRVARLAFGLGFVLPLVLGLGYYLAIASPRYASDLRMTLRTSGGALSINAGLLDVVSGQASYYANPDTYVVAEFLRSREAVELVSRQVDLRAAWGGAGIDPLSRLAAGAPVEDLVATWQRYVSVSVDALSNSVQVEIQAFAAGDASRIGEALAREAEAIVNGLTRPAREDAVRFAEARVSAAEAGLAQAREAVRAYRDEVEAIAPDKAAGASLAQLGELMTRKLGLERELAARRRELSEDSPVIARLRSELAAVEGQIADINRLAVTPVLSPAATGAGAGTGGSGAGGSGAGGNSAGGGVLAVPAYSAQFQRYDELLTAQILAERLHGVALDLLEAARRTAQAQRIYVTPFVRPAPAHDPRYPKWPAAILRVTAFALLSWLALVLIILVTKDDKQDDP